MQAKCVSPTPVAMVTKICKFAHYIYYKSAQILDRSQIFAPNWVFWSFTLLS